MVQLLAFFPHSKKALGLKCTTYVFPVSAFSPHTHGGSGVRLTRDSKLSVGVSVRVNGCLSLFALQQAGDLAFLLPYGIWDGLQTLNWMSAREWKDGFISKAN